MWGIVEEVIGKYVYVIYNDEKREKCLNTYNFKISENNQVLVKDGVIVDVKEYDEQLYSQIKQLEEKIFKKKID